MTVPDEASIDKSCTNKSSGPGPRLISGLVFVQRGPSVTPRQRFGTTFSPADNRAEQGSELPLPNRVHATASSSSSTKGNGTKGKGTKGTPTQRETQRDHKGDTHSSQTRADFRRPRQRIGNFGKIGRVAGSLQRGDGRGRSRALRHLVSLR